VSSPVSLRPRLIQPVPEAAGMYLSTVETRLDCRPGSGFWDRARQFHSNYNRASTDEEVFLMPLMLGALSRHLTKEEMAEAARIYFNRPVKYDFSITNLGRLVFPARAGALHIEYVHNLVNASEHERTVSVSTFEEKMSNLLFGIPDVRGPGPVDRPAVPVAGGSRQLITHCVNKAPS
jgi:hypothetical protein